ncbi:LysR family transcriptional regulator [Mesorhizobium sp. KR2-14]|uniref:LysR family transcriptional regulator n=1 Tax=Mesorhizobium sp. KR2-14 TaxID=3156610 RepID=UPI0032B492CB
MQVTDDEFIGSMQKFGRRLDWNLLKTFHDIVQANGITAAANVGWRKQSTISLALKRLESILDSRLCQRGRAGFELTDEGRILYEYVRNVYVNIDEIPTALENLNELISGQLKVAIISNLYGSEIDRLFTNCADLYRDVVLDVDVQPWASISNSIVNNDYDIGITPILYRHNDLRYDFLMKEFHGIYCGAQHPLFGESPGIAALSDEAFVLTGSDEPDSLTSFRLRHRLGHKVTARTPNLEEARRLAVAGVGICILPEQLVASDVASGSLWPLMERSEEMCCDIYAVTNIHAPKRLAREAFVALVAEINSPEN